MPKKNVLKPYAAINGVSMGTDITSTPINVQYLDNISIQLTYTGTPSGTFSVLASNDYSPGGQGNPPANTGNWTAYTFPTTPTVSGSAGTQFLELNQIAAAWIEIKYTRSSSTGTLTATVAGKSVSG